MTTDSYIRGNTYSLPGSDFEFLSYFLCHVTLKLAVSRSRPPVLYGANLCFILFSMNEYIQHCSAYRK